MNKSMLIGRLGRDPEVRVTPNGKTVANFSIATSEKWTDKATGNKVEHVEWHRVVAFGNLAEICGQYLNKGKQIFVEGRLQTREWTDKDGVKRYTTEIVLSDMQMLGSKENGNGLPGAKAPLKSIEDPVKAFGEEIPCEDPPPVLDRDIPF